MTPAADGAPALPTDAAGVYIHVPFCAHVCPYCDFNTYAGQESLIPRYVAAVEREIAATAPLLDRRRVASVFLGGGTPSLLAPDQVGRMLAACRASFDLADDAEVTLEANPNGVDAAHFAGLLAVGVNRLSLGAQTLDRRGLRTLGRIHEAEQVGAAVRDARAAGFANLSLDLIFGWPGQTLAGLGDDLDAVLGGAVGDSVPEHLSLYSLIVEPGTPMADAVRRGILVPPDDDTAADLYELAIERLARAGWVHYEVANWAKTPALGSRHNRLYWRNGDYLGIGAGAHGHVGGERWMNHLLPATYCREIEAGHPPRSNVEHIPPRTAMGETMMLGLRLLEDGVDAARFADRHGLPLAEVFGDTISELGELGLVQPSAHGIRLTRRGLLLANDVCARFL
ncbi:MAG: radical SAM family heme chaperone HemW [Chloroflexia bacterium]|nr:radical SAM family heme chaperone HemW [Chloroflexia bacterium]